MNSSINNKCKTCSNPAEISISNHAYAYCYTCWWDRDPRNTKNEAADSVEMTTKYVSKQTHVEAILSKDAIQHAKNSWDLLPKWLTELYDKGDIIFIPNSVLIPSDGNPFTYGPPKSWKTVPLDDMIVLDGDGKITSYNKDIFFKYYDKVEE